VAPATSSFARPPSTQEAVLAELRKRLGTGALLPGSKLSPDQLALELGVSRVPIREALMILEGEGQVRYRPRRGFFVAEFSLPDLRDVYRMRELLETEAASLALEGLDAARLDGIEAALVDADGASGRGDLVAYAEANRRFHLDLFAASERRLLVRTIRRLWDATDTYRALYANDERHRRRAAAQHRAILDGLRRGDIAAVIAAQDDHRADALEALAAILDGAGSRGATG